MADNQIRQAAAQELVETGRLFNERGWARGAGGNFSVLLSRKPLRLCITSAGNDKGMLDETNFLELDDDAEIVGGFGLPADETLLHLAVYQLRPRARCILYSQSVWGVMLSDRFFVDGSITFQGYEALKGFGNVDTHEHVESVPIIENSQDRVALSHVVQNVLLENESTRAIFFRRHGLYAWGDSVAEARRNIETLEFLAELKVREAA